MQLSAVIPIGVNWDLGWGESCNWCSQVGWRVSVVSGERQGKSVWGDWEATSIRGATLGRVSGLSPHHSTTILMLAWESKDAPEPLIPLSTPCNNKVQTTRVQTTTSFRKPGTVIFLALLPRSHCYPQMSPLSGENTVQILSKVNFLMVLLVQHLSATPPAWAGADELPKWPQSCQKYVHAKPNQPDLPKEIW